MGDVLLHHQDKREISESKTGFADVKMLNKSLPSIFLFCISEKSNVTMFVGRIRGTYVSHSSA